MSDVPTLCRCGATIDAFMFETRRRLILRVHGPDEPFTPPKLCTRCFLGAIADFLTEPEPFELRSPRA